MLLILPSSAHAEPSAGNRSAAQALFEEGRALMGEGKAPEACPKLEESQRLDPGVGTQFNLAACYEAIGRTASAWTLYMEVAAASLAEGRASREATARERALAVKSKLSYLIIEVPHEARVPGLVIERSGERVGEAQWGARVPVDPGEHRVRLSAPEKKDWEANVKVPNGPGSETVKVPVLADAPKGSAILPSQPPSAPEGGRSMLPYVAAGVGIVGVGVGAFFGLQAMSKYDEAQKNGCNGGACTEQHGFDLQKDARSAGNVATVGFIVGIAGLGTGAALYLWEPARNGGDEAAVQVSAEVGPRGGVLVMGGRF